MQKWGVRYFLLCVFLSPIHKWIEKPFRRFSRALLDASWTFPPDFPKRVGFFFADLPILAFIVCLFFLGKWKWKEISLTRKGVPAFTLLAIGILSILGSSLPFYGLHYIRLFHFLGIPLLVFCFLAQGVIAGENLIRKTFQVVLAASLLQCTLAIGQYITQDSVGLFFLEEPRLTFPQGAYITVPNGCRWIFDSLFRVIHPSTDVLRVAGTFPHPNHLGGFLFFSLLGTSLLFQTSQKRWFYSATIFVQLFTLFITYSRAALLAWTLSSAFFITILYLRGEKPKALVTTLLGSFAFCTLILAPQVLRQRGISSMIWILSLISLMTLIYLYQEKKWQGFFLGVGLIGGCAALFSGQIVERAKQIVDLADVGRLHFQSVALKMIMTNPFLGIGFNSYLVEFEKYGAQGGIVHNIYLLIGAEMGLLGLLSFVWFIWTVLREGWEKKEDHAHLACLAIFIGFIFIGFCDFYLLWHHSGRLIFFITAGLLTLPLHYGSLTSSKSPSKL